MNTLGKTTRYLKRRPTDASLWLAVLVALCLVPFMMIGRLLVVTFKKAVNFV